MFDRLAGSRVLVVGGSSGIGEASAALAAQNGALVTIASRSPERLRAAIARLPAGCSSAVLDVTDAAAVEQFFQTGQAWSHVVLTGAATKSASSQQLSLADARASMDSKFWGAYYLGRSARVMDGGSITFVSGVYSVRPNSDAVLQGAINAALEGLARGLALERAPAVRVNVVSPSTAATPLWDRLGVEGRAAKFSQMSNSLPLRRIADPRDLAEALLFLALNPFATGTTLLVDGGDALL